MRNFSEQNNSIIDRKNERITKLLIDGNAHVMNITEKNECMIFRDFYFIKFYDMNLKLPIFIFELKTSNRMFRYLIQKEYLIIYLIGEEEEE